MYTVTCQLDLNKAGEEKNSLRAVAEPKTKCKFLLSMGLWATAQTELVLELHFTHGKARKQFGLSVPSWAAAESPTLPSRHSIGLHRRGLNELLQFGPGRPGLHWQIP